MPTKDPDNKKRTSGFRYAIRHPRPWMLALFYLAFVGLIAATIVVLTLDNVPLWAECPLFAVSAAAVVYYVCTLVWFVPRIRDAVVRLCNRTAFAREFLRDYGLRTVVMSTIGFVLNLVFAAVYCVMAFTAHSVWYGVLAGYWLVLCAARCFTFVRAYAHRRMSDASANDLALRRAKVYFAGGWMLVVLALALSGTIVLISSRGMGFRHTGLMIYAAAAYTFYKVVMSIYHLVKAGRRDDDLVRALRNFGFADASVSVLALQTAMFAAFSPEANVAAANTLTGAIVGAMLLAMGIVMIVRGARRIRRLKAAPADTAETADGTAADDEAAQ